MLRRLANLVGGSLRLKVLLGIMAVLTLVEVVNLSTLSGRLEDRFRAEHAAQSAIVADTAAELLKRPLWEFNFSVLASMVDGLANEPGVDHVVLRDAEAMVVAQAGAPTGESLVIERFMVMSPRYGGETIGTLEIGFDETSVGERLAFSLRREIIGSVTFMLLMLIPLVLLADHFVRPLAQLAAATRRIRSGDLDSAIPLQTRTDEVGALAGALDALRVAQGEVAAHQAEQEQATKAERQRMLRALSATSDGVVVFDREGRVTFKNRQAGRLLAQIDPATILPSDPAVHQTEQTIRLAVGDDPEIRDVRVRSDPILDNSGQILGRVLMATDTTVQERARKRAEHAARHDALTGLPNRRFMEEQLRHLAQNMTGEVALLVADLDRFKVVNDGLGHIAGDDLLCHVAGLLAGSVVSPDTPFRIGGDEFAIVATGPGARDRLEGYSEALLGSLSTPIELSNRTVSTGLSIGIAGLDQVDGTPSDFVRALLNRADLALYDAKARGGNTVIPFRTELELRARERERVEAALRRCLETGTGLSTVYQPQTNVLTREVTGFETLARLVDADGVPVNTKDFITSAEETGLIVPLTRLVLHEAMCFARRLAMSGFPGRVAVNISPMLFSFDLGEILDTAQAETGCPPGLIELEITEQTILEEDLDPAGQIDALRARGYCMVLDDFGVGYSSFNYLQKFNFDKIKIDRSFAVQAKASAKARAIILAITQIGHALGAQVVAEGIETADDFTAAQKARIDTIQGWIDGKPRKSEELDSVMAAPEWWCNPKWLESA